MKNVLGLCCLLMLEMTRGASYPLHDAALKDDTALIKTLASTLGTEKLSGALAELDNNGMAPLHIAAYNGASAAIGTLVKLGAKIEETSHRGKMTALHWAAARAQTGALQTLLDIGALVDAKDEGSKTALHYAASRGQIDILKALLKSGAQTEAQTANGVTAIQMAAEKAQSKVIKALAEAGANVQAAGDSGKITALHAASYSGHMHAPEAVQTLLSVGAKLDALDAKGRSPLMLATEADDEEVIEILKAAAAARRDEI